MGFSADLDLSSKLSAETSRSNHGPVCIIGPCSNIRNYIQDKLAVQSPEIGSLASEDSKQNERKKEH